MWTRFLNHRGAECRRVRGHRLPVFFLFPKVESTGGIHNTILACGHVEH